MTGWWNASERQRRVIGGGSMVYWSYKTVHFALKKDGLLGGAFLDDVEMEETLNQYGHAGWELVSVFETRDGVMAVFKQPGGVAHPTHGVHEERWNAAEGASSGLKTAAGVISSAAQVHPPHEPEFEEDTYPSEPEPDTEESEPEYLQEVEDDPELFGEDGPAGEETEDDENDSGVGAIRIE